MAFCLARGQNKICSTRYSFSTRLSRATVRSLLLIISSQARMTACISLVSITRTRGLNWPRQPFNQFAVCALTLEKLIWPLLSTFTGRFVITIMLARSWLPRDACYRTNLVFLSWLATSIDGRVSGRNLWRKQALELDPRNFSILQQISLTYQGLRRYKEMAATLDTALTIAPKDIPSRIRRASVDLESRADTKPLHTTIETILTEDPNAAPVFFDRLLLLALRERDPAAAQRALSSMPADGCYDENIPFPNGWCEGLVARLRGDEPTARAAFTNARKELVQSVSEQPNYATALCALGVVDAALGNKDNAIREGQRAVELMPVSKSSIEGATLMRYLAVIYALAGEKDRAIEQLAEAAKLPGGYLSYGHLRLNPMWDPLRGDPRFEAIVASLAAK